MCMPGLGGRIEIESNEFDNKTIMLICNYNINQEIQKCKIGGNKKQWWYQHLICLDVVQHTWKLFYEDVIYSVYDLDENSNEIRQKR